MYTTMMLNEELFRLLCYAKTLCKFHLGAKHPFGNHSEHLPSAGSEAGRRKVVTKEERWTKRKKSLLGKLICSRFEFIESHARVIFFRCSWVMSECWPWSWPALSWWSKDRFFELSRMNNQVVAWSLDLVVANIHATHHNYVGFLIDHL